MGASFGLAHVPPFIPGAGSATPAGGGSSVPTVPSQGGGSGPIVRFLPDWVPIPSAQEFNTLGQKATVAIEANIELPGAALTLPVGIIGRIASITLYVANLVLTSQLSFTVTINGNGVQGYTNVAIFPGAAARLANTFECFVRVPSGGIVQVFYSNADGGSYTVGAALSGWQWLASDGDRWIQQGS